MTTLSTDLLKTSSASTPSRTHNLPMACWTNCALSHHILMVISASQYLQSSRFRRLTLTENRSAASVEVSRSLKLRDPIKRLKSAQLVHKLAVTRPMLTAQCAIHHQSLLLPARSQISAYSLPHKSHQQVLNTRFSTTAVGFTWPSASRPTTCQLHRLVSRRDLAITLTGAQTSFTVVLNNHKSAFRL